MEPPSRFEHTSNNINNNNDNINCGFAVPADHRVKLKESERNDKYFDLARELKKKTMEHESDVYTNFNWYSLYSHRRIIRGTGGLGNERTSGDHPNYYISEISQNTVKSPGDLRKLGVTQTSVKYLQQTLIGKTLRRRRKTVNHTLSERSN